MCTCPNKSHCQHNGVQAQNVTVNNYYGCGCRRSVCICNHGRLVRRRRLFGLGVIGAYILFSLRQARRQRQVVRDLQARIAVLEKQKSVNAASLITLIKQNAPKCDVVHETRHTYARPERRYIWTWVFGMIGAAFGLFGSVILTGYFRSTIVTDDTPLNWIATSIAGSEPYAWLFTVAATFVVTAIFMAIGYLIDSIVNRRPDNGLTGPVN